MITGRGWLLPRSKGSSGASRRWPPPRRPASPVPLLMMLLIYPTLIASILRLAISRLQLVPPEGLLVELPVYLRLFHGSEGRTGKSKNRQCLRERPESQPPLNWPTRKQIALGAARGLHHCNLKIIHRTVKAATILLDESFEAVFCGFGLAMLMDYEETHVETVVGTLGYIAPEYLSSGKCSVKTDVYSYGITLLELISGQEAFDLALLAKYDDVMLVDWVLGLVKDKKLESLVDGDLAGNYIDSEVEQLIQLALLCTQSSPIGCPEMSEVIMILEGEGLEERWEEWRKEELPRNNQWIIEESDVEDTLSEPR